MGYNVNNYNKIKEEFEKKRTRAIERAEANTLDFHSRSREALEIDRALSEIGLRI